MTTLLLDTHVLHWWSAEPERVSPAALRAIERADQLAVASVSWYELAWLGQHRRIIVSISIRTWLERMARQVLTVGTSPGIAAIAAALPASFPSDPADRVICATALEQGWELVTKDERLLEHEQTRRLTIW